MHFRILLLWLFLTLCMGWLSSLAQADFQDGLDAYDRGDYATALNEWLPMGKQGDPPVQFLLGIMYYNGKGVPQDFTEAGRWYRLAAEQGYAGAQYYLGLMYENGEGVSQDDKEAFHWYRLAAEQGHAGAQTSMGIIYLNNPGMVLGKQAAVRWFSQAAEQGNPIAQYNLGLLYDKGQGVPQDYVKAYMWADLAVGQDYRKAQELKNSVAARMTEAQIEEAQLLAREWLTQQKK